MTKRKRAPRWYHGGVPGLSVGELILPACELARLPATYAVVGDYAQLAGGQHVYIVRDRRIARSYAAKYPGTRGLGTVYQVEPIGAVELDPDYTHVPTLFRRCQRARIVEVIEERVPYSLADEIYVQQHATWDNGDRMYDRQGYLQPSPEMRALGITRADLRPLGVLADGVDEAARRLVYRRAAELGHTWTDVVRITQAVKAQRR